MQPGLMHPLKLELEPHCYLHCGRYWQLRQLGRCAHSACEQTVAESHQSTEQSLQQQQRRAAQATRRQRKYQRDAVMMPRLEAAAAVDPASALLRRQRQA